MPLTFKWYRITRNACFKPPLSAIFSDWVIFPFINIPSSLTLYREYWSIMHWARLRNEIIVALFHHCFKLPSLSYCRPVHICKKLDFKRYFGNSWICTRLYHRTHELFHDQLLHRCLGSNETKWFLNDMYDLMSEDNILTSIVQRFGKIFAIKKRLQNSRRKN